MDFCFILVVDPNLALAVAAPKTPRGCRLRLYNREAGVHRCKICSILGSASMQTKPTHSIAALLMGFLLLTCLMLTQQAGEGCRSTGFRPNAA